MTDVAVSRIPAGWYPDPLGQARHRWWDSTTWTQHVTAGPRTTAAPSSLGMRDSLTTPGPDIPDRMRERQAQEVSSAAPGRQSDYVPMAMHPRTQVSLKSLPKMWATVSVWTIAVMPLVQLAAILALIFLLSDFGRFMQLATGFVFLLWCAVLATRDRRTLVAAGHPDTASPWWLLLSPLAYLIARTIKVRHTTGSGSAPLWTYLTLATLPAIGMFVYLSGAGAMHLVMVAAAQ